MMPDSLILPFHDWLVELRRDLHQIPELGYQEEKTAAKICSVLDQLEIPYQTAVGKTGVVARLKADKAGPLVAYRADMDALPLEEANDVLYKSQHQGRMHACGHDGHVTVALGIIFLGLQSYEYIHAYKELNLTLEAGVYGATFYMLTGFHGFHVTMGTIMLFVILVRSIKGHFTAEHHFGFEGVAWYWHFVDVVWLGLFIFVYAL